MNSQLLRIKFVLLALLSLTLVLTAVAQTNNATVESPQISPAVGSYMSPALKVAMRYLSDREFDKAKQLLSAIAYPKTIIVYLNIASIPAAQKNDYVKAVKQAIDIWNSANKGLVKFELKKDQAKAKLVIQFEPTLTNTSRLSNTAVVRPEIPANRLITACSSSTYPITFSQNQVYYIPDSPAIASINSQEPEIGLAHKPASIAHLVARELGSYLGLKESDNPIDIMGPDTHTGKPSLLISKAEIEGVLEIAKTNKLLINYANKGTQLIQKQAIIVVDHEEQDAGKVNQGDKIPFVFNIKNNGNIPLIIDAKPTCRCTVADFDKTIAPGQTGKIESIFNSTNFRGDVLKHINVTTNDEKRTSVTLSIKCKILPSIVSVPDIDTVQIIYLPDSEAVTKTFTIFTRKDEAFEIVNVNCSSQLVKTNYQPWKGEISDPILKEEAKTHSGYQVNVTVPAEWPIGRSMVSVNITTNHSKNTNIPIRLSIEKGIIVEPASIFFGKVEANPVSPIRRYVILKKRSGNFKILGVETGNSAIEATVTPITDGSAYKVVISYKGGWQSGSTKQTVKIKTDDRLQPIIEVEVECIVQQTEPTSK